MLLAGALHLSSVVFIASHAESRGFLVTSLTPAVYDDGEKSCPGGIVTAPDTEAFLAKKPKAEREKLLQPGNRPVLAQAACLAAAQEQQKGQDSKDEPPSYSFTTVQGKVAYGFDLNRAYGKVRPAYYCQHENFISPEGEEGVDNQWYRALGCLQTFRPGGLLHEYFNAGMRAGEFSILISIDGIDNPANDDEVQVGFYTSADPKAVAKQPGSTAGGLRVLNDKYYHAVVRGKIKAGVVTTEPVHMRFQVSPLLHEMEIRDARAQFQLAPDGSMKGLLGGYQEIQFLSYWAINRHMEEKVPTGATVCTSFSKTVAAFADGYPDPKKDGPCGWISVAYQFEAVPAKVTVQ